MTFVLLFFVLLSKTSSVLLSESSEETHRRFFSLVQVQRECRFLVSICMSSYRHFGTDSTCGHLYCKFTRNKSGNNSPRCPSILPVQVYGSAAAYAHSTEVAGSPAIRQGRKQMDKALMTLQQHFADSRRATVVAINLERRMRTEQIRKVPLP